MKSEVKNKTKEELVRVVEEGRSALKVFRFGVSGSRVKNVREARNTRRNVARALSLLSLSLKTQ